MKNNWIDNFGELYKQRGQHKYGIRLLAMWKLQSGMTMTAVCKLLGKTQKTVRKWRSLYESAGIDSLLSIQSGRGRKAKLDLHSTLGDDIKALEKELDGGRIRCQDIVDKVYSKYGVQYSKSGMYCILHRLGFSWITSRSKHPKNSPEAIDCFKKLPRSSAKYNSIRCHFREC